MATRKQRPGGEAAPDWLITELDLHLLAEGRHLRPFEVLGALPMTHGGAPGVRFALWAPHASAVSVVGPFNAWDGRRHPMRRCRGSEFWEVFVPGIGTGELYQYELHDAQGHLLPLKADPYARAAELRPARASIVAPLPPRRALPPGRSEANDVHAPISIYELHAGSWQRHGDGRWFSWDELAQSLPQHVAGLGFTHVELLPITEHPFDASWGYQALGLYAPTARHGSPEAFQRFVNACHAAGLGVLLDWVPAHFPRDDHGLASFDGTALYEYADPREGLHRDWHTAIYDFGRPQVCNFLLGSALYWVERFGLDGLRIDAVSSMLYRDYSRPEGEWVPNVFGGKENLEAVALLKRLNEVLHAECPGTITIAEESTAWPGVSRPTKEGGLGFSFKWNLGWMNDTLRYMKEDPIHRKWHHAALSFGLVYAFDEHFVLPLSHDEVVHGKGSLLQRMPGDDWQRFANLRAYLGFMWGHPGKKLLFMGQEFAQPQEWNHEAALPWQLLEQPRHAGVQRLVQDLNRLYREQPALHRLDGDAAGFQWIEAHDDEQSVYAWMRHDGQGRPLIVVCNFTPVPRHGYRLGVFQNHPWREVLNTDADVYGGSNVGQMGALRHPEDIAAQGSRRSIVLSLPPLATIFLVPA